MKEIFKYMAPVLTIVNAVRNIVNDTPEIDVDIAKESSHRMLKREYPSLENKNQPCEMPQINLPYRKKKKFHLKNKPKNENNG